MYKTNSSVKRMLSLLLASLLIFGLLPLGVLADGETTSAQQIVELGGTRYYDKDGDEVTGATELGDSDSVVSVSKTIAGTNTENEFMITLDVETTVDITNIELLPDAAVVLVIDISGSMHMCSECGKGSNTRDLLPSDHTGCSGTERYKAARAAAIAFLNSYVKDCGDAKRMVSLVTFATDAEIVSEWVDVSNPEALAAMKSTIGALTAKSTSATYSTNMHGGLMLARNLLRTDVAALKTGVDPDAVAIQNRYVVLLSDGDPNKIVASTAAKAEYSKGTTVAGSGNAGNYSTDVNTVALQIKNGGTFTVGSGQNQKSYTNYSAITYTIAFGTSANKGNLGRYVSYAQNTNDAIYSLSANKASDLNLAFEAIAQRISLWAQAWTVIDPMGDNIVFNSDITTDASKQFIEQDSTLKWELQKQYPDVGGTPEKPIYTYTYTYQIKLDTTQASFTGGKTGAIDTNGETTLTYVMLNEKGEITSGINALIAQFTIPAVEGYAAPMNFTKIGGGKDSNGLLGCTFALANNAIGTHSLSGISAAGGVVAIADIPSGHSYTLKETSIGTNTGYKKSLAEYEVTVSYGELAIKQTKDSAGDTLVNPLPAALGFKFNNPLDIEGKEINITKTINGEGYGSSTVFTFGLFASAVATDALATTTITGAGTGTIQLSAELIEQYLGETLYVKEIDNNTDSQWVYSDTVYTVHISDLGAVTVKDAAGDAVTGNLTFTNEFTKHYTVTVEYYVNGVLADSDVAYSALVNGARYDAAGYVLENYLYNSQYYAFSYATNSDINGTSATTLDEAKDDYAVGKIKGKDVVIKLYYTGIGLPNVSLTKSITKATDETWPDEFSFTFTLNNGKKDVATLTLDQDDFDLADLQPVTGSFAWLDGVDFYADLSGKTLTITESSTAGGGNWVGSFANGDDYVFISDTGAVDYLFEDGSAVGNDYDQNPVDAYVVLRKYFTVAEGEELVFFPGYDGSVLDCGETEHEHDDNCYGLTCTVGEHTHGEDCYDDEENLTCTTDEHEHDDNCYGLTCTTDEHTHDDGCYVYTFTFTLKDAYGKEIDELTIKLTKSEIEALVVEALVGSDDGYETLEFYVPAGSLPASGSGTYTISESGDYTGWTLAGDVTVTINRLGTIVSYPGGKDYAEMDNIFGGINRPSFSFSKQVLDARDQVPIADYTGTFTFELYDGSERIGEYTITGSGTSETIYLDRYLRNNAELTLKEVAGSDAYMEYDKDEYSIEIKDGVVVHIGGGILFTNTYLEPIVPEFTIAKTTNGRDGTFKFSYSYGDTAATAEITTTGGNGSTGAIALPTNFNGSVFVTEVNDGQEGWIYDNRTVELIFENGICTNSGGAVATFANNYFSPGVELSKDTNKDSSVLVGETITYTLTVTNTGDEDLTAVEVKDSMFTNFADATAFSIVKKNPSTQDSADLVAGEDYSYDGITGALTFGVLEKGYQLIISYAITAAAPGSLLNEASVTAIGKDTEIRVSGKGDKTVTVTDPDPDPDPTDPTHSITKQVAEGRINAGNDVGIEWSSRVSVNDRATVTFKIVVRATGDSTSNDTVSYVLTDVFDGQPINLELTGNAVTLTKNDDNSYGPAVIYYTTTVRNLSGEGSTTLINAVTIGEYDPDDPDVPKAEVEVGGNIPGLDVEKQVAQYVAGTNYDNYTWASSTTITSRNRQAIFKVTVTNNSESAIEIVSITDNYNGNSLEGANIYYNGATTTLAAMQAEIGSLASGDSFTFYYVTGTLTTRGTFTNVVTVTAIVDGEEQDATDRASVVTSWDSGGGGGNPDTPYPPGDDPTEVDETDVPLTDSPERTISEIEEEEIPMIDSPEIDEFTVDEIEELTIEEDATPLGDAPKTGDNYNLYLFLTLMLGSAAGLAVLLFTGRKSRKNEQK